MTKSNVLRSVATAFAALLLSSTMVGATIGPAHGVHSSAA